MTELMDLALPRVFVTVARTGSVNLAAGELHLSQASVSRHVQRLEAEIGAELFARRDGRPLELTAAGRRVVEPSARVLADAERDWARLRALAGEAGRRLRVGCGPAIAALDEVATAAEGLRAAQPELVVELVDHASSSDALRELIAGTVDLVVSALGDGDGGAFEELAGERFAFEAIPLTGARGGTTLSLVWVPGRPLEPAAERFVRLLRDASRAARPRPFQI